jgi:hypothetical protein
MGVISVSQARAGAAKAATPARPRNAPPTTVAERRSLDLSRFTPTPVLGIRGGEEAKGRRQDGGEAADDASPRRRRHGTVATCNDA